MLRDIEKVTNTVTGEALMSLIREDAPVSNESLATRCGQVEIFIRKGITFIQS